MTLLLQKPAASATPIHLVDRAGFDALTAKLPAAARQWMKTVGFSGAADSHALMPDDKGRLSAVWAGVREVAHPYALGALPTALPAGNYRLGDGGLVAEDEAAALSWSLGSYAFDLYKPRSREAATLMLPAPRRTPRPWRR